MLSTALMRTVRAMTVCCIAELAFDFFEQNLALPCSAVTFDNSMSANTRVSFRSVITHTDYYICVERTNHRGTGSLKRVTHSRSQIICVAVDEHQASCSDPQWEGRIIK
jgi:hypothetical protein